MSAPGNSSRGFTLIELMVVVALIAVASAVVSLSMRDPAQARLEQEATRLAALLEAARAESRASGLEVRWETYTTAPLNGGSQVSSFRFIGLPPQSTLPARWLSADTSAQIVGARAIYLGPEPLIGPQRLILHEGDRSLLLATDGLTPFSVIAEEGPAPR
jgi:general secretion pathway protein H